jgi:oligoendopeptidase F
MAKKRSEVPTENQWNVEAFYPSFNDWQTAFQKAIKQDRETLWKELSNTQGKLGEKPEILKSALDQLFFLDRELSKLYTYAHLRHDEDIANDSHKVAYNQITSLLHEFAQTFSWIEPEILALPDDTIQNYLSSPIEKVLESKNTLYLLTKSA